MEQNGRIRLDEQALMLLQTLSLCPKSWKMLCLLELQKEKYNVQQLPLASEQKLPALEGSRSDMSYIFEHFTEFIKTPAEANAYGFWCSLIDGSFIPEIIMPIRYERVVKPIVLRQHSSLVVLQEKRKHLKAILKEFSNNLEQNTTFSLCNITLATALATLDYLGEISWHNQDFIHLYNWYLAIKSHPVFSVVLKQKCHGIVPNLTFTKKDF